MINSIIIIDDFIKSYRRYISLTSKDVDKVNHYWNKPDVVLVELSRTEFFKDRTVWSELKAVHYKILISSNLNKMDVLTEDEINDDSNKVIQSLIFLLGAFIRCIEEYTDMKVESLKIQRLPDNQVIFSFMASITIEVLQKPTTPILRIVVDNT